jgi:hypothetical protein
VDPLKKLLRRQYGLATDVQLREAGVSREAIRWRIERESWQRALPRVVATFSGELTRRQQLIAAGLFGGAGAQIAGVTALEVHEMRYAPRDKRVHIMIPEARRLTQPARVRILRTKRLDPMFWPSGILRISSPARAVVDTLRGDGDLRLVRAVVAEAVQRQMATVAHLTYELDKTCRNGTAILRQVLAEIADGVRSAPEAELHTLTARSRLLPAIRWNPQLRGPSGVRLPTPDGYIEDAGIALEVDSREFHLSADGWRATLEHHNRLAQAGILVLHFTPAQLRGEPLRVLAEIERAYVERVRAGVRLAVHVLP